RRDAPEGLARDDLVVERHATVGQLHVGVRALAGDDDNVARASALDRPLDRLAPVDDHLEPVGRTGGDLGGDGGGILGSRVVGGDDGEVRAVGGGASHQRALLAVAVAARAEHGDHTAVAEPAGGG